MFYLDGIRRTRPGILLASLGELMSAPSSQPPLINEMAEYFRHPEIDLVSDSAAPHDALPRYMLRVFIPLWATAGIMDWYWHKKTDIEHTAGISESLLHFGMFTQAGVPLLMGLFMEVNAGVFAVMAGALVLHEATAFVDVRYALHRREVRNWEQHTHSFLEILPFAALSLAAVLHWGQFRAFLGAGPERPDFRFRAKSRKLPKRYIGLVAATILGGVIAPYFHELWRCWKARNEPHYNAGFYE
jgi:hypothetical protein